MSEMSIPEFTAEASLYRTTRQYSVLSSGFALSPSSEPIVPAYYPGPGTQHDCYICESDCAKGAMICAASAAAEAIAGCVFSLGFGCAGAVAAAGVIMEGCASAQLL